MCDTLVFLISRGLLFLKEKCFPKLMELGNLLMAPREQPCMAHLDGHFAFSKNSFCGNILMISEPLLVITCTYVLTSMVKQSLHHMDQSFFVCMAIVRSTLTYHGLGELILLFSTLILQGELDHEF